MSKKPRSRRTKILGSLLIVGTVFVAIEAGLQVMAYVTWAAHAKSATTESTDGPVVLCVGDSFTYGYGATDRDGSYPSQLQEQLRRGDGPKWTVANHGWPGRNSREILERLPGQLRKYRPKFVYVVVGVNDKWSHPERLTLAAENRTEAAVEESFRFEFRTGRLLAFLFGERKLGPGAQPEPTPPLDQPPKQSAGLPLANTCWIYRTMPFHFAEDGTLHVPGGSVRWRSEGDALALTLPDGEEVEFRGRVGDKRLVLTHPDLKTPVTLFQFHLPGIATNTSKPRPTPAPASGWDLHAKGELEAAETWFLDAIAKSDDGGPFERWALVNVLLERGKDAAAQDHVRWLAEAFARRPDREIAESYLSVLEAVGRAGQTLELLPETVRSHPESAHLWAMWAWHAFQAGDHDTARTAIEKALTLTPDDEKNALAHRLFVQARIDGDRDPRMAARNIIRIYRLTRKRADCIQNFQTAGRQILAGTLDETLKELRIPKRDAAEIRALFAKATDRSLESVYATYRHHIGQILDLCLAHGAEPVLATYPHRQPELDDPLAALAKQRQTGFLDISRDFAKALQTAKRSELFVPDGHCNDRGYGIMAQAIHADLQRRLREARAGTSTEGR